MSLPPSGTSRAGAFRVYAGCPGACTAEARPGGVNRWSLHALLNREDHELRQLVERADEAVGHSESVALPHIGYRRTGQ